MIEKKDDLIHEILQEMQAKNLNISPCIFVVYSKSRGLLMVMEWKKNRAGIVAFIPVKEEFKESSLVNEDDVRRYTEEYFDSQLPQSIREESFSFIRKTEICGIDMFLENGKIYDYGVDGYYIVEAPYNSTK